jgi:hypothetical protein
VLDEDELGFFGACPNTVPGGTRLVIRKAAVAAMIGRYRDRERRLRQGTIRIRRSGRV